MDSHDKKNLVKKIKEDFENVKFYTEMLGYEIEKLDDIIYEDENGNEN